MLCGIFKSIVAGILPEEIYCGIFKSVAAGILPEEIYFVSGEVSSISERKLFQHGKKLRPTEINEIQRLSDNKYGQ